MKYSKNIPIAGKTYRYFYVCKNEMKKQIEEMLGKQIIRTCRSSVSAPVWIVKKKTKIMNTSRRKKCRFVIDYGK